MLRSARFVKPWKLAAALLLGSLVALAVLFLVTRSGSATQGTRPSGRIHLPPFEMVRVEKTSDGHEAIFHLLWENEERWKETFVSTNRPVPPFAQHDPAGFLNLGAYRQAIDGKLIHFDMMRPCLTCPVGHLWASEASDDATLVPGQWFVERGALVRTRPEAEVSETETEVTVRVKSPVDIEEWVYDRRTGIPVGYRTMTLDGRVHTEWRAKSVVLLSGEVVR